MTLSVYKDLSMKLCYDSCTANEQEKIMMNIINELNFEKMTVAEKLSMMEKLWNDLCANPESIPSPEWHREVLETREQHISEGKEQFHSLESVKSRIKDRTS